MFNRPRIRAMGGGGGGGRGGGGSGGGGLGIKCGEAHNDCHKRSHHSYCDHKIDHSGKHKCKKCGKDF